MSVPMFLVLVNNRETETAGAPLDDKRPKLETNLDSRFVFCICSQAVRFAVR